VVKIPSGFVSLLDGTPVLFVSGEGKASAAPDEVHISASIETRGSNAMSAQQENSKACEKVFKALSGFKLSRDAMKTIRYGVSSQGKFKDLIKEYVVSNVVEITLRQQKVVEKNIGESVSEAGKVIDAISKAGAVVQSVGFDFSDQLKEELSRQALDAAGKNAMATCKTLEKAMGFRKLRFLNVKAGGISLPGMIPMEQYAPDGVANCSKEEPRQQNVFAGTREVTASVSAVFEIA